MTYFGEARHPAMQRPGSVRAVTNLQPKGCVRDQVLSVDLVADPTSNPGIVARNLCINLRMRPLCKSRNHSRASTSGCQRQASLRPVRQGKAARVENRATAGCKVGRGQVFEGPRKSHGGSFWSLGTRIIEATHSQSVSPVKSTPHMPICSSFYG